MNQFAIIGAGQLGSRHLQSLATSESQIWVYDPFEASLEVAKQRLSEINLKAKVVFSSSFDSVPNSIDLVVIATNSDVRFDCIKQLTAKSQVKNIILEKVLFNKLSDYTKAQKIFDEKKINVWVNCPRRSWDVYKNIKAAKNMHSTVNISVHAGELGLASNAIHFIDLISSLIPGESLKSINLEAIDSEIINSRRKNFLELTGTLRANFSSGSSLNLHFQKNSQAPVWMLITFENLQYYVNEAQKKMVKYENAVSVESTFNVPFQSQLTLMAAEQILTSGNCDLSPYSESMNLHIPMMSSFLELMKKGKADICPIT